MQLSMKKYKLFVSVVVVLKRIIFGSVKNRIGAEGLYSYYPSLLCCPDQMLAVMALNQRRVWSFRTVTPLLHVVPDIFGILSRFWSAFCCFGAPHLQFGERARPCLCMDCFFFLISIFIFLNRWKATEALYIG